MAYRWLQSHKKGPNRSGPSSEALSPSASVLFEHVLDSILDAADRVLNLSFGLIAFAFCLQFGVTGQITKTFLHFAAHVLGRTLNTITVRQVVLVGHYNLLFWTLTCRESERSCGHFGRRSN